MIQFTPLDSYSENEIEEASQFSFPLKNYIRLVNSSVQTFSQKLRQKRHKAWCECVLAIYFKKHSAKEVCFFWSQQAEELISEAWGECGLNESSLALFVLGKLGCDELNLSSDVDLMIISQNSSYDCQSKVLQFQRLLQENTEFGFVFRLDFDLRAGGRFGPQISTYDQFEDYYGNYGDTLDRMAFIRLKGICGHGELINKVQSFAKKFTFRRFIDHALIADFQAIRPKIHSSFRAGTKNYNLKVNPGGIRDIELFTHALLVIHGGKNPQLQESSTDGALTQIANANVLPHTDAEMLIDSYWKLRDLENRAQAMGDQQIHSVNLEENPFIFAETSISELKVLRDNVDKLVSTLLGESQSLDFSFPTELTEQKKWLADHDFSQRVQDEIWERLHNQKIHSKSVKKDKTARLHFLDKFLNTLTKINIDNELAVHLVEDFLNATRAKSSFLTLFNREPDLIKNLAFLFSTSPYLGGILSSRPELIDSFLLRQQEDFNQEDFEIFLDQLSERKLLGELIAANDFLSLRNIDLLLFVLSQNADHICSALLERLKKELDCPESTLTLLTMGKWAGKELGFRSDLDFIFVTKEKVEHTNHKLARKFLNTLSARQRGGSIYDFDLRLRPSGNSGPLIISIDDLVQFLTQEAKPWERQAYLKSRLLEDSHPFIQSRLQISLFQSKELQDLKKIRLDLFKENQSRKKGFINLKYHPGGLVDTEFCIQVACFQNELSPREISTLGMLEELEKKSSHWQKAATEIKKNYNFLRELEQLHQLTTRLTGATIDLQSDHFLRIAKIINMTVLELREKMTDVLRRNSELFEQLDPIYSSR